MSSHFSANQYETAFSPQRLQNYQIPAKHKERPSMRTGCTTIISNNQGHLNGEVTRSTSSPWGSFMGTWQMERNPIQLKTRTKLMAHLSHIGGAADAGSKPGSRESGSASKQEEAAGELKPQSPAAIGERPATPLQVPLDTEKPSSPAPSNTSQQSNKPPTPSGQGRPETSTQSVHRSIHSPRGSNPPSAQGSRVQSPVSSVQTATPPPPPSAGGSRGGSAQSGPRAPSTRPESRMGDSRTQSPLGSRPPPSHTHSVSRTQTPASSALSEPSPRSHVSGD